LSVLGMTSNSQQQFDLGSDSGGYKISYFDNDVLLLLRDGSILAFRKQSGEANFDISGGAHFDVSPGLMATSLTSDGTYAFFVLQDSTAVPPPPELEKQLSESKISVTTETSPPDSQSSAMKLVYRNAAAMRMKGVYKLDLQSGEITGIAGFSDAISVSMTQDKSKLIVVGVSGVSIVDIRNGSKHFFANISPVEQCSLDCVYSVLNPRWVGTTEGAGWHFIDLQTLTDWHLPLGSPRLLKMSRASTEAVAFGSNGAGLEMALIDLEKRTVLSRTNVEFVVDNDDKVAISDIGDRIALLFAGIPDADGVVMRLDPAQLQIELCAEPGHNLDRALWNKYLPGETWEPTCSGWK
jgi:hypothetical protein